MLGGIIGPLLEYGAKKVFGAGDDTASMIGQFGKIGGDEVPRMMGYEGKVAGRNTAAFNKEAYPGVTPYELAGSGAGGSVGSAGITAENARRMQREELKTRKDIAKIQAHSTAVAAGAPYGKPGIGATVSAMNNQEMADYTTAVSNEERKVPSIISKNKASARRDLAAAKVAYESARREKGEAEVSEARGKMAKAIALQDANRNTPWWIRELKKFDQGATPSLKAEGGGFVNAVFDWLERK